MTLKAVSKTSGEFKVVPPIPFQTDKKAITESSEQA